MEIKEIIEKLKRAKIKVSKKQSFYSCGSYGYRYNIIGSPMVDSRSDYLNIPIKSSSQGFIVRNNKLQNFYYHNGDEFETTKDIDIFINKITTINNN